MKVWFFNANRFPLFLCVFRIDPIAGNEIVCPLFPAFHFLACPFLEVLFSTYFFPEILSGLLEIGLVKISWQQLGRKARGDPSELLFHMREDDLRPKFVWRLRHGQRRRRTAHSAPPKLGMAWQSGTSYRPFQVLLA